MTDPMPLHDAVRWIGPHDAILTLTAPDSHAYAEQRCDHHGARADHHWPAWATLELYLSPDDEATDAHEASSALRAFAEADWRDVIDDDPIPPWAMRDALEEHGMRQQDLADMARVSIKTIEAWLSGSRRCSGPAAMAVSAALQK